MPEHTTDDVRRFVGNGVRKLMERAVPEGTANPLFEHALATFREHYTQHSLDTTQPYPGIIDMMRRLKGEGKAVAVVSNKFDAATKALCSHFFGTLVDVAIGESERIRKKPAPDTVVEALKLLNVDKSGAVYIGDSDVDIDTARNSGISCISVTWGFRSKQFLIDHGAVTCVDSPMDIR
jgi:phosphoglycolate phosphatase